MNKDYTDVITQITQLLFSAICQREPDLETQVHSLDRELAKLLRLIGWQVMSMLLARLSEQLTQEAKATGLVVQRRKLVKYAVLFGPIEVSSPYLWDKTTKRGARPVKDQLRITNSGRSLAVERALADFGAEESYQQAAKRFEEHYGWEIDRYRVRRAVVKTALKAEQYVEEQLHISQLEYEKPLETRPGQTQILVQLDGCHIRTATLVADDGAQVTQKRQLAKKKRKTDWREVRVGLARPLQDKKQRTFVARMSKYPEVVGLLVSAAVDRGMSKSSKVYAVADGGNGLREELVAQFPGLQFILDRPHLKEHFYEAAEAMGLNGLRRHKWVKEQLELIDSGGVQKVLETIAAYRGRGQARLNSLCNYLQRFSDSVDYDRFVQLGLPIGSGEIESAHRYIPQKRLKIPGATWHGDSINPMLALRIIRTNDWWNQFWQPKNSYIP